MRIIVAILCLWVTACGPAPQAGDSGKIGVVLTQAQTDDRLYKNGQANLKKRLRAPSRGNRAKNVILMVADGLDPTTVTAARIYDGQSRGEDGEGNILAFERFEHLAMAKTYTTDFQVPDSAGTITAMMTGVKTRSGVINYGPQVARGQCASGEGTALVSISTMAEKAGMMTGVVSTARLTHATPAAVYASAVDRGWEDDSSLPAAAAAQGCKDIASQLIDFPHGDGIDVVLGGGAANFLPKPKGEEGEEGLRATHPSGFEGRRKDGRDLSTEWVATSDKHKLVTNTGGLNRLIFADRPLGLFSNSHMDYTLDRDTSDEGQPSLAQMTQAAIRILAASETGYVLVIEAGRVDHAHHAGNAARALADAQAFSEAVGVARNMTQRDETLIIATADHGHTMTMSGYPIKGNPILGLTSGFRKAADGKAYTTLNYANGPGAAYMDPETGTIERPDINSEIVLAPDYRQQAAIPLGSQTHGGQDVTIYADGPGAWLFTGTVEQSYVFHVMAHVLGFEPE